MKETILLIASLLLGSGVVFAQYDDDIYYNPAKKTEQQKKPAVKANGKYYNPNLGENGAPSEADVDAYNGYTSSDGYTGYYESPVDTIGDAVANSEDFVYTQQIQKYYNPTIVTDNSAVLADVLNNSYGNVSIVYNGGVPLFGAYSYWWPYSYSWYSPYWSWSWSWGPSWSWYNPWYYPGWGPSWAWGPSWGWYDPWYWGPSYSYPRYHAWYNHHRGGAGRPGPGNYYNRGLGRGSNLAGGRPGGGRGDGRPGSSTSLAHRNYGTATSINGADNRRGSTLRGNGATNSSVTSGAYRNGNHVHAINGTQMAGDRNSAISSAVRNDNRVTTGGSTGTAVGGTHSVSGSLRDSGTSARVSNRNATETTVRGNSNSVRGNSTYRNNNGVTTRNNNSTYRNNTNTTRSNSTYRNNSGSSRSNSGSFRQSGGGSRGGFGGGSGRMGGGGSRGGGGHRR